MNKQMAKDLLAIALFLLVMAAFMFQILICVPDSAGVMPRVRSESDPARATLTDGDRHVDRERTR